MTNTPPDWQDDEFLPKPDFREAFRVDLTQFCSVFQDEPASWSMTGYDLRLATTNWAPALSVRGGFSRRALTVPGRRGGKLRPAPGKPTKPAA